MVGYPHDVKGQGIYCYVTLMSGETFSEELRKGLRDWVRKEIGPIASPDLIHRARLDQDALGQDHAPRLAQDCGRRFLKSRRHLDAPQAAERR